MLKKLLSAILTAAMILSFIPTAFASGETAATEVENVKIVYAAGSSLTSTTAEYYTKVITPMNGSANKPFSEVTDYSMYNGFWMYGGYKSFDGTAWDTGYKRASQYGYLEFDKMKLGYWHGLKFHVPVSGTYDMTLYAYSTSGGGHCRFAWTVVPASTAKADIDELMKTVSWNATSTDGKEGTLSASEGIYAFNAVYEYGSGANPSQKQSVTFDEAGDYILVLQNVQYNPSKTTTDATTGETTVDEWNASKILLKGFSLSKGENPTSVPMGITSLTDSEITVGETTTASFGNLYGSGDWAAYDTTDSTITYVSSNEKVATVTDDGTVTGEGVGTAEISAVIDGATLVSAPITVGAPSIKIVYDIANSYSKKAGIVTSDTAYYSEVSSNFVGDKSGTNQISLPQNFEEYTKSNGLWRYAAHTTSGTPKTFYGMWQVSVTNIGEWYAIGFNVPVEGTYDVAIQGFSNDSKNYGCSLAYQIFPKGTTSDEITEALKDVVISEDGTTVSGSYLCWQKGYVGGAIVDRSSVTAEDVEFSTAGEYILVAKNLNIGTKSEMYIDHFILTQSDKTGILPIGYTKLSANEIAIGATTTASISDKLYNANDWGSYDATGKTVTYASSNPNVAMVDAQTGEITAKAVGTAEITAIVDGAQLAPATITVEEPKISLAVANSVDDDINVEAYKAGSVTVTAPTKSGNTFSHWVRGTADNGVWVSSAPNYTFDLVSPTYLTAIYVEDGAKIVEFFNGNGELLAQKEVVDGKVEEPAEPKMVGFTFLNWILGKNGNEAIPFVNENIEKSLRVVADYAVESTKYTVDDDSDLVYDAEVVKNADSEDTVWYRGGIPVGYGKTYTYNVWADTTITSDTLTGEKTPLVYLDTVVKTVGDEKACMIEFDGAGKEIVEVGILFSNSGTPEVGSCQYKATSKTNGGDDGHGQLTAKPANDSQTVARGYLIYNEDGEYKTVYSEVLSLS